MINLAPKEVHNTTESAAVIWKHFHVTDLQVEAQIENFLIILIFFGKLTGVWGSWALTVLFMK